MDEVIARQFDARVAMFLRKKSSANPSPLTQNLRRKFHHVQLERRQRELSQRGMPVNRLRKAHRHASAASSYLKKIAFMLSAATLAVGAVYTVFFSAFFAIAKISVEQNGAAVSSAELQPFLDKLKNANLLFLNTASLETAIEGAFENKVLLARVKKLYPSTVKVKVDEYPAALNLVVRTPQKKFTYTINQIGYAIAESAPLRSVPTLTLDASAQPAGKTIIDKARLEPILRAITRFQDIFGMKINEGIWKKTERELHLKTEKNFVVWIDLTWDVDKQLMKLKRALSKLDIYREKLEYIDLRIAGVENEKVLFKRRR